MTNTEKTYLFKKCYEARENYKRCPEVPMTWIEEAKTANYRGMFVALFDMIEDLELTDKYEEWLHEEKGE